MGKNKMLDEARKKLPKLFKKVESVADAVFCMSDGNMVAHRYADDMACKALATTPAVVKATSTPDEIALEVVMALGELVRAGAYGDGLERLFRDRGDSAGDHLMTLAAATAHGYYSRDDLQAVVDGTERRDWEFLADRAIEKSRKDMSSKLNDLPELLAKLKQKVGGKLPESVVEGLQKIGSLLGALGGMRNVGVEFIDMSQGLPPDELEKMLADAPADLRDHLRNLNQVARKKRGFDDKPAEGVSTVKGADVEPEPEAKSPEAAATPTPTAESGGPTTAA